MPAPKRIPDQAIREAIVEWRGSIAAAADALGIWPANLRKRLNALGIDVAGLKAKDAARPTPIVSLQSHRTEPIRTASAEPIAPIDGTGQQSEGGIFPRRTEAPRLSAMQPATKDDDAAIATSIPAMPPRQRPIRFHPADQDRLRTARLDLIAKHRVEFDESAIHHKFFEDKFDEWIREQLDTKPAPRKRTPARRGEGGE